MGAVMTETPTSETPTVETPDPNPKKWYVVHTYSGYEYKAKKSLEERIKLESLDELFGEILIPTEQVVEMVKGSKRTSKRKFFPGYMLVHMVLNDQTWHTVKNTPKITGFVGGTTNPAVSISNIRLSMAGGDVLHEFPTLSMLPTHVAADPDGDGYSNLFEYALGGNPNLGNDVGTLPNLEMAVDGIDFVFNRRRDAATHGIRYDIETTESLTLPNSWELVSLDEDGIDIVDAEFETVTHRLDTSGKAHEFIRLSIGEL